MASTAPPEPALQDAEGVLEDELDSTTEDDMAALDLPDASLVGLREISPLASWTVSTCKPGCGVAALRSPSTSQFWQSDGPQPHLLNIHFFKLVYSLTKKPTIALSKSSYSRLSIIRNGFQQSSYFCISHCRCQRSWIPELS